MNKVLLIFIDGLGLGEADPAINPLVRFDPPFFRRFLGMPLTKDAAPYLSDTICVVATDATLGVAGLPQSATGQTALFTGINAPAILGRHILGFPGPKLGDIIAEHGVMMELADLGYSVTSANMYGPNYFELVAARKWRHSASTLTILGAGLDLRSVAEMHQGEAVYQDITNKSLPIYNILGITTVEPYIAGQRLAKLADNHDFTMFEYFQTDRQGHKNDWSEAQRIVGDLTEFLAGVQQNSGDTLVIVTSDHGNFEDFSTKTHTLNYVPTIIWGPNCREIAKTIKTLTDIKPAIIKFLAGGGSL